MITHFQRFTADDPIELRAQIERAQSDLRVAEARTDEAETFRVAASLGSMLTTARREEEARALLSDYLARARKRGTSEQVAWLLLFLATANQYLGHRGEALRQFDEAHSLATAARAKRLEHFVLHHWGRFFAEAREIDRARECFTRALELRVELGDPKQASSRRALEALRALANENGA